MDMLQPLIDRLKAADLAKVAEKADVSRKTLVRIMERSNSPTFETAGKIVKALDTLKVPRRPKVAAQAAEERAEAGQGA